MKKTLRLIMMALIVSISLSACATPLGQQYGILGGAAGAAIGGAAGGVKGAIIGGAAGAAGGGLIGDQQQYQLDRERYQQYHQDRQYRERPCRPQREPLFNRHGEVIGSGMFCR